MHCHSTFVHNALGRTDSLCQNQKLYFILENNNSGRTFKLGGGGGGGIPTDCYLGNVKVDIFEELNHFISPKKNSKFLIFRMKNDFKKKVAKLFNRKY